MTLVRCEVDPSTTERRREDVSVAEVSTEAAISSCFKTEGLKTGPVLGRSGR